MITISYVELFFIVLAARFVYDGLTYLYRRLTNAD